MMIAFAWLLDRLMALPPLEPIMWALNRFGSFVTKRVAQRVHVEGKERWVQEGNAGVVAFDILVRHEAAVKVAVVGMNYQVKRDSFPIQGVLWSREAPYATNGLRIIPPDDLKPETRALLSLLYNPNLIPNQGELGQWEIEGVLRFRSFYGHFSIPISERYRA